MQKTKKNTKEKTKLKAKIERILYHNEESNYTILKTRINGDNDLVTVVGNIMHPSPGDALTINGEWATHPKYGPQFKMHSYDEVVPETIDGIERYLGSGLIKGIGPTIASRIVKRFGADSLEVIENNPVALAEIEGIGAERIIEIKESWKAQKEVKNLMVFLQTHEIGTGHAMKIFKEYGNNAITIIKNNPYRLAMDISGIGFIIADKFAEKMDFEKTSIERIEVGILYVLHKLSGEGHAYYPYSLLVKECVEILDIEENSLVEEGLKILEGNKKIVIEVVSPGEQEYRAVYPVKYYHFETEIADSLHALIDDKLKSISCSDPDEEIRCLEETFAFTLAEKQKEAIRLAIESKVLVITGGPGTGKSTIISAIIEIFMQYNANIALAAPTGRAAKRLNEITDHDASTIHRLLKFNPGLGGFEFNKENPLECDLLIVDEASMIDTMLMYYLLNALPEDATLILVGDINQLPSVGAGNILADIIKSGKVPVVELNEIFRQARESQIVVNAHKVNSGELPINEEEGEAEKDGDKDFYFIESETPEKVTATIIELVSNRITKKFGFDPTTEIQVLSPMRKGHIGVLNLNTELQKALNPGGQVVTKGTKILRKGDKVMQIKNNYEKGVFNGDIGIVVGGSDDKVLIMFHNTKEAIEYGASELSENLILAYAISVHKSQGSEFPAVIIPVHTQHYIMLQRNLLYTGITRGKKLVVLVGTKKALNIAVKNNKIQERFTYLRNRLC